MTQLHTTRPDPSEERAEELRNAYSQRYQEPQIREERPGASPHREPPAIYRPKPPAQAAYQLSWRRADEREQRCLQART